VAHLLYTDQDYARLRGRIKCNPSIKSDSDRQALRRALTDGRITCIGTDHAPHLLSEKQGGACKAVSGMPMVQFSLVSMLEMVDEGVVSIERLVQLMCHNPADLFGIKERGYILEGMKADLVLVNREEEGYAITSNDVLSKCGWSPREGDVLHWKVRSTWVNGNLVWDGQLVDTDVFGEPLGFEK
jgi:dihydroorotase